MKKLISFCLVCCCFMGIQPAHAQFLNVRYDSLKRILPLQKTAKGQVRVLQQLVDEDPLHEYQKNTYLDQLLAINKTIDQINPRPYEFLQEAIQFVEKGQQLKALNSAQMAVNEFDKQHRVIFHLLISIRQYYNAMNDQEARLRFYQQKLEYYQVNGPFENVAAVYHGIAGYYRYNAEFDRAITYYLKAGEIFKKFNLDFYGNELNVAGNLYTDWGNYDKAVYYLKDIAIPFGKKIKNNRLVSMSYYCLSKVSIYKQDLPRAIIEADDALIYSRSFLKYRNPRIYAAFLTNKGQVYIAMGKPQLALPLLDSARVVADSGKFTRVTDGQISSLELDYAYYQYNRLIKQNTLAERYLLVAVKKAEQEKANDFQLKYLKEAADLYKDMNKPTIALQYYHQYFLLQQEINRRQSKLKIAQFETQQIEHRQQQRISALKQQKALQDYQISRRNALLWVSLVVVLLISGLLVFIYRQLQINKRNLASLQKTQQQLIQSEKMASLGELTAGIAHEIQNPLNFVNNFSEVNTELIDEMLEEIDKGDLEEAKEIAVDIKANQQKINQHGKRADFIVKGMLQHSRTSTGERQLTDINILADEFLKLSYHGLRAKDKTFNSELITRFDSCIPKINIVQQDIGRVLLNLFNNAFYAVQQKAKTVGPEYKPEVSVSTSNENGRLAIVVRDNGNGIPDAIKDKIMQPFFTTKPTGEGTGLGLSLSYDIVVKGHGGEIEVDSVEREFTAFTIFLPLA